MKSNIWKLASVKLLLFLIPAIIIVSIAGTLIPQGEKAPWYVYKFGQPWAGIIIYLNLRDVYHSFFFIGLLSLLALNLAVCSLKMIGMLKERAGVFVTHTAIIIVLLGGMISGIWGKRGVLHLYEGETKEYVEVVGKGFRMPFGIKLKRFLIEYYEGDHHRRIKQFKSHLEIIENDSVVHQEVIYVNKPLRWRGYNIYQSGYDPQNLSYSSLLVSKDPGVGVVYTGFALLPLGLFWAFFRKPKGRGGESNR